MGTKQWYEKYKEEIKRKARIRYHQTKMIDKPRRQSYYEANKETLKEQNHLNRVRRKFGLTPEQYQQKIEDHSGRCAICGNVPDKRLCVDHNHITGQIRGLLCSKCNTAIALLKENVDILNAAQEYLMKYSI